VVVLTVDSLDGLARLPSGASLERPAVHGLREAVDLPAEDPLASAGSMRSSLRETADGVWLLADLDPGRF